MGLGTIHRLIRAVTKHYCYRRLAPQFNIALGRLVFDRPEPLWLVSPAFDAAPAMVLNVSNRLQRKIYYFPKAWCRWWLGAHLARFMERELVPGSIFLDIGANVGIFSLLGARLVGQGGRVLAFEPDPDICESLWRSAQLNCFRHLRCANVALSNHNGQSIFYRAWHGGDNSLVPETLERKARYREAIQVPVRTLDDYLQETDLDVRRIRLIKVDVEGEEVRTVAGMLETLERAARPLLWVEVRGPHASTRAPNTFPAVHRYLAPLGYRAYRWVDGRGVPVSEQDVLRREDILFRQ
jgi:FkbM family methyltransferase